VDMSSDTFLYLETRGRKTGLPRQIEIWFTELPGRFYVMAEMGERAHWVQNIRARAEVQFSIGTHANQTARVARTNAHARILNEQNEPELTAQVSALMDAKYDWSDGLIIEIAPSQTPE
jgi:deazaflavin-dependent oxidoreductase (nitroreductase family)